MPLKAAAKPKRKQRVLGAAPLGDLVGSALSTICVVHCLATPTLAWALPTLKPEFLGGREFHRVLAVVVLTAAVLSIVPAFVRHRRFGPLALAAMGLALLLVAAFAPDRPLGPMSSMWLTVGGGCLLTLAHVANWRSCCAASIKPSARSVSMPPSGSAASGAQSRTVQNSIGD